MITAYFFLFFKTYSEESVAQSADHVVSLDTKRITNTVIWTYLTTPSLWKVGRIFSSSEEVDWNDMVRIPDYVFAFHVAGQPNNLWYAVFEVKDEEDFSRGLAKYGFEQIENSNYYLSKKTELQFVRYNDKLLLANGGINDKSFIAETAEQLFQRNKHIERSKLQQNVEIGNHVAWTFSGNDIIKSISGSLGFDKASITSLVNISFNTPERIPQMVFDKAIDIPVDIAITQPPSELYGLVPESLKQKTSRWLNFNIDSLFLPSNSYYQLQVGTFISKNDTAISYSYDDNFNPIEKKVVNKILEPSFDFEVYGSNVAAVYNYWNNTGILEKTPEGELFTSMPLVKSYCSIKDSMLLNIRSNNWQNMPRAIQTDSCFLSASVNALALTDSLIKYIPDPIAPFISKIATINILAKKANAGEIKIETVIARRKDKLWFE